MSKPRWAIILLVALLAISSTSLASAQTCDIATDSQCAFQPSPGSGDDPSSQTPPPEGSSSADEKSSSETIESLRERMLALVNSERANANLPPLVVQSWAESIAGEHSIRMAAAKSIWHNDDYFARGRKAMGANLLGENVAMGVSVEGAHRSLMGSPPHRQNILDSRFSHAGIGIARGQDGMIYVTEGFARISVPASPQPQPLRSSPSSHSESPANSLPTATEGLVTVVAQIEATETPRFLDETSPAQSPDSLVLSASSSDKGLKAIAVAAWLLVGACMLGWRTRIYFRDLASLRARVAILMTALSR